MAQTTIVFKISDNLKKEVIEFYQDRFIDKKPPYSVFQVKDFDCVTTLYESGKIMFQGFAADIEASFWIERERILNNRNVNSELEKDKKKKEDKKKELNDITYKNISTISEGRVRHDAGLVASSVIELICNDLKYQDKQNDPQYMLLNSKLESDKRINRIKSRQEKDQKRKEKFPEKAARKKGRQSKFRSKYQERILSIKESDAKIKQAEKKAKSAKKEKTKEEKLDETYQRMSEFRKSGYKKNG